MRFSRKWRIWPALVAAACLQAQNIVVRGPAPTSDKPALRATPLPLPDPAIQIVVLRQTLADGDPDRIRAFAASLLQALRSKASLAIETTPVRTAAEIRTVFRDLSPAAPLAPADFATSLPGATAPIPASPWTATLIVGRPPPLADADPEVAQYAAAWLIRQFIAQKRSVSFWDPEGNPPPPYIRDLTRFTGGIVAAKPSEIADALFSETPLTAIDWAFTPPPKGFRLDLLPAPFIAKSTNATSTNAASTNAIATPAEYAELRTLTARAALNTPTAVDRKDLDRALAINPADWTALQLAIAFFERANDADAALPLLKDAVQLRPAEVALWIELGEIQYAKRAYADAEATLLQARSLGATGARLSEQLGRIRYQAADYAHAVPFIDESLHLDAAQQDLWFLAADIAVKSRDTNKAAASLEQGLALGGRFPDQREKLIRIYLAKNDLPDAARHADAERPFLGDNADRQSTWARFYEDLARPADALASWTRAAEIDPQREPAHAAIAAILLSQKRYPDVLLAADRGLAVAPRSPALQLARATALEKTGRVYEARLSLRDFAATSTDLALLQHQAELADTYGGDASTAYRRLAEALAADPTRAPHLQRTLERGQSVALRDSAPAADWFTAQLPKPKPAAATVLIAKPITSERVPVAIPGGIDALMFIAGGHAGVSPQRFFVEYCRTVVAHEPIFPGNEALLYQKTVANYFAQLRTLLGLSQTAAGRSVITLSIATKEGRRQAETVLNLLGWKLRTGKAGTVVESVEKAGQASKQELASALAIDQGGMQDAFQAGKPFRIEIPWDTAPLFYEERLRPLASSDKLPGGLPEAFARDPHLAHLYLGLSALDPDTAVQVVFGVGMANLAGKLSSAFALYAPALSVTGGRVVVPGGAPADPVWTRLAGASPADPPRFFHALFEKDDGRLLVFYFVLSNLDAEHQKFFTRSDQRAAAFYRLYAESPDGRASGNGFIRNGSFSEYLRSIPLIDGSVDFPGGAEVWMVAKGESRNPDKTRNMLKKVSKAVAPEVEDEILLRIAGTTYKSQTTAERLSEVDNFLAVARIDAHRSEPLDADSALMLAQNYSAFGSFYPYFAEFKSLTAADFRAFFQWAARAGQMGETEANLMLGLFHSATESIRLALRFGGLPEDRAVALFRALCARFTAAQDSASYASAALDTVRELVAHAKAPTADLAMERLVTGTLPPVNLEWNGVDYALDAGKQRSIRYRKVLGLQNVPPLAALLVIDEAARNLAAQKGNPADLVALIETNAQLIPVVEVTKDAKKDMKLEGRAKQLLARDNPSKITQLTAEVRQKIAKKKVNPADLAKLAREILTETAPQVQIALTGIVYAAYFDPDQVLVANDAFLLRKHRFFDLRSERRGQRFVAADLIVQTTAGGSYFMGGFNGLSRLAGRSAAAGAAARKDGPESRVFAAQLATVRMTPWFRYGDADQQSLGQRLRIAREWCVYAAARPALLKDLGDDLSGLLPAGRKRELLNAIALADWPTVWQSVTLSDLLFLSDRYLARYPAAPWPSPVDAALRAAHAESRAALDMLGSIPLTLHGCDHPHLVDLAPYEEYQRHLFPEDLAERTAEFKIYLSELLDRMGLPAAALPSIAEPAMDAAFRAMRMSDLHDWSTAIRAFAGIDAKTVETALGATQ